MDNTAIRYEDLDFISEYGEETGGDGDVVMEADDEDPVVGQKDE